MRALFWAIMTEGPEPSNTSSEDELVTTILFDDHQRILLQSGLNLAKPLLIDVGKSVFAPAYDSTYLLNAGWDLAIPPRTIEEADGLYEITRMWAEEAQPRDWLSWWTATLIGPHFPRRASDGRFIYLPEVARP